MAKLKIRQRLSDIAKSASKNSSLIFTVAEVAGVVATSALAVDATVKTLDRIRAKQLDEQIDIIQRNLNNGREIDSQTVMELTEEDRYKLTASEVIDIWGKTVIAGGATITCAILNHKINMERQAALVAAAGVGFEALYSYRQHVTDVLGSKADEKVLADLIKSKRNKDVTFACSDFYEIFTDPNAVITLWDEYIGFFEITPFNLLKAEYEINHRLQTDDYVTLYEWYDILGHADEVKCVDYCKSYGWSADQFFEERWYSDTWFIIEYIQCRLEDGMVVYDLEYAIKPYELETNDRLSVH